MAISKHSNTIARRSKTVPALPQPHFVLCEPRLPEVAGRLGFRVLTDSYRSGDYSMLDVRKGETIVVQVDAIPVPGDCVLWVDSASLLVLLECRAKGSGVGFYLHGTDTEFEATASAILAPVIEVRRYTPVPEREFAMSADVLTARLGVMAKLFGVELAELLPKDEVEVVREVLTKISSSASSVDTDAASYSAEERRAAGNTQVNVDLAMAALCEAEHDIAPDGPDFAFFDLAPSSEYKKLRALFIEDATTGVMRDDAFQLVVWRSYNAGRYSPYRLAPLSREEREEVREGEREAERRMKALREEREASLHSEVFAAD